MFGDYRRLHPGLIRRIGDGSEVLLAIPDRDLGRHPDLAVAFRGAPRDATGNLSAGLVFEVVSPGREARDRDYVAKREENLALSLLEYWIVDFHERRVTVLTRREGDEGQSWNERVFRDDQVIHSPGLPGFLGTVDRFRRGVDEGEIDET